MGIVTAVFTGCTSTGKGTSPTGGGAALPAEGRNDDIEVLRALAVLLTIVCHFGYLLRWQGRWSNALDDLSFWGGVDLFFCISGFVITSSLLRQRRSDSFARLALPFWTRRIFRLWPAALLWLVLPLVGAELFNTVGAFGRFRADLTGTEAAAAEVANFYYMVCSHTGGPHWPCGKAEVYWSLSLEEQFYLVFPLLLYFLRPVVLRWVLIAVIVAQLPLARPPESPLWYVRTDAISFGVLIALARLDGLVPAAVLAFIRRRTAAGWLAILLLAAIAILPCVTDSRPTVGVLALIAAALVVIASENANVIVPVPGVRAVLLWIGSRSFAIYLAHDPCFWATREIFHRLFPHTIFDDRFTLPFITVALVLIGLTSEATYRIVEVPLRTFGRGVAKRLEQRLAHSSSGPATSTSIG